MLDNDQAEPNPVHTEASNSVSPRESTQLDNSEHSDPNPGTPPEASQQDWPSTNYQFNLINVRSLANKLVNFQSFIYSSLPDIIGVTETWLNDSIMNNEILPYDYSIYRKDRGQGTRGGGVLLAIHNSIPTKLIASPSNLELIAVELIQMKCTVCTVYLPPNVDLDIFTNTLSFLIQLARECNILIIGDFNRPVSGSTIMSNLSVILFSIVISPS